MDRRDTERGPVDLADRRTGQTGRRTGGLRDRSTGGPKDRGIEKLKDSWTERLRSLKTDGQRDALYSVPCIYAPKVCQVDRCKKNHINGGV